MNHPDQRIDQILQSLATVEAPGGLEDRVRQRIANLTRQPKEQTASEAFLSSLAGLFPNPSAFAVAAALALLTAVVLTFHPHTWQQSSIRQQSFSSPATSSPATVPLPFAAATTLAPAGPAVSSNRTSARTASSTLAISDNPDAVALVETLAPSQPVPPLPLTAQEALLLRATRPGQPIEVAELDTLHESALNHVAELRERATLRQYVHSLLAPLEAAQGLTPPSPQPDEATAALNPDPSSR